MLLKSAYSKNICSNAKKEFLNIANRLKHSKMFVCTFALLKKCSVYLFRGALYELIIVLHSIIRLSHEELQVLIALKVLSGASVTK
jgi:hypothetical protein